MSENQITAKRVLMGLAAADVDGLSLRALILLRQSTRPGKQGELLKAIVAAGQEHDVSIAQFHRMLS